MDANDTQITLLDERGGTNRFHLEARGVEGTGLLVEGHDIGPITAPMNNRGDYEWRYVIGPEQIPRPLELLGAPLDADIMSVLTGWTGPRACEFERLNREFRSGFFSG